MDIEEETGLRRVFATPSKHLPNTEAWFDAGIAPPKRKPPEVPDALVTTVNIRAFVDQSMVVDGIKNNNLLVWQREETQESRQEENRWNEGRGYSYQRRGWSTASWVGSWQYQVD